MFIVCGTFNNDGGEKSYFGQQLLNSLGYKGINGGYLDDLINFDFSKYSVLIWMPNIDNSVKKILPNIKKQNKSLLLISSKRVIEKTYNEIEIIGRLLKSKSNLGIMIEKTENEYNFKLLDPLGNIYCNTSSILELSKTIQNRVNFLLQLNRVKSLQIGTKNEFHIDHQFIDIIKKSGHYFSKFVNAVNPERLLGNASIRLDERIFVSRRNVDKKSLSEKDFVEVINSGDRIEYYGDLKPSVDTPIQVRIFSYYKNIKYIIHGHVYIKKAPYTHNKIPCGFLEEFNEIMALYPDKNTKHCCVNLKGHGCLIMSNHLENFETIQFLGRPFPEN